jgi:hypothetical protein
MELRLVEARWRTGRLFTSELPGVAAELLAGGHSSPALRELAASTSRERADARELFDRALAELGHGEMTETAASLVLARQVAVEIVSGALEARLGARGISALRWRGGPAVDGALAEFSKLHDRYEALGGLGPVSAVGGRWTDRRVRAAAARLLADAD